MISRWKTLMLSITALLTFIILVKFGGLAPHWHRKSPLEFDGQTNAQGHSEPTSGIDTSSTITHGEFDWSRVPQRYPVTSVTPLPSPVEGRIPRVQFEFKAESTSDRETREARLEAVKSNFTHAWRGYKEHAWLRDEVMPLSGRPHDPFGGWAATLVDSLDTLWIMGLHEDFREAINAVETIDFTSCSLDELNVFETTIRYLGGFLSAYDLSDREYPVLLRKATEMAEMLYTAFDTPNRLPVTRWDFRAAAGSGSEQQASDNVLVAELGSLTLEWTRLTQLTGDPRYFDAVQRIMDLFTEQQQLTKLPGMWPVVVNAKTANLTEYTQFTIGGMADSLYEYLIKEHILLGGGTDQYRMLYTKALDAMRRNIFYRPMTPKNAEVLIPGQTSSDGKTPMTELKIDPEVQHLGCFAGGMVALGARVLGNNDDLETARQLVEGCLWAYETMPNGIMPEIMHTVACPGQSGCKWDEGHWLRAVNEANDGSGNGKTKMEGERLPEGVTRFDDKRYILRPEAIESVFILYRITGDVELRDRAWTMFNMIAKHTITEVAHAALDDCILREPPKADRMESFWLAETLKYFYLIFSEPNVVSLDEYVFNTEAHPLKRPI